MARPRHAAGFSATVAAAGTLFLSGCLFGGEQDAPPPGAPALSDSAPRPGWYKGDYGPALTGLGIESEIILSVDSAGAATLQFLGIIGNFVELRAKGDWSADADSLRIANHAQSRPAMGLNIIPVHSGVFDNWSGLQDTAYAIRVYDDGSFARLESVLPYFDVDPDSLPVVVRQSPEVWVRYRPARASPIAIGRYEYRENFLIGDVAWPGLYRDLDFRGCGSGEFVSRLYVLNSEVRQSWIPPYDEGWYGWELKAARWSQLGSFLVAGDFRERQVGEFIDSLPWVADPGEYLLRVIPFEPVGLAVWWSDGFWSRFGNDTASCPSLPPPSALFPAAIAGP